MTNVPSRKHYPAPWAVHATRRRGELVSVEIVAADGTTVALESLGDGLFLGLEQLGVSYERIMRCVNACELLKTDDPMREIESLLRDRAALMTAMARGGFKRPSQPVVVLHPGEDEPQEAESAHLVLADGRKQIGPTDV